MTKPRTTGTQKWARILGAAGTAFFLLLHGGEPRFAAQEQATQELRERRHSLWQVRSPTSTLYLLGSVHLLKPEHYPLGRPIEEAFDDSRKLVLEIRLDNLNPQVVQGSMLAKGRLEPGQTLQKLLAPTTYALLKRRAEEMRVPVQALEPFKPWVAALTLSMLKLQQLGYEARHGVDQHFARKARQEGKEILELESFEAQINLFEQLLLPVQEAFLLQTLKDLEVMEKQFQSLLDAWMRGDAAALETILLASFREHPEIYRRIVADRNRGWLAQLEKILAQNENAMVVVGAGHLVGEEGLIELLRARGYGVEQR
ncbi:MAG: TraB/GumN family protein [Candidatus Binatia bacterium]